MKKSCIVLALIGLVLGCSGGDKTASENEPVKPSTPAPSSNTPKSDAVNFAMIQPTMQQKCIGCHGDTNPKEGLSLTSYANVMKGGEHGPVVIPGDPDNSRLVQALRGSHGIMRMPAKADPLPEETIAAVEAWIRGGAKE
jgi:mono/diheme cytochrome c family protein